MNVVEEIRNNRKRSPFRPFSIRMKSGDVITVPSQDYVLVPPEGNQVVVVAGRAFRLLDHRYIAEVAFADAPAKAS
jgi:hypothetical protein